MHADKIDEVTTKANASVGKAANWAHQAEKTGPVVAHGISSGVGSATEEG
jgi:hypothetical protein